jgi:two-component system sensor histidine kinase RpfC
MARNLLTLSFALFRRISSVEVLVRLRNRLRNRRDSEHEQALLRIAIVGLFLAYMTLVHDTGSVNGVADDAVILLLASFFVVGLAIFAAICLWPAANIPRRLIGMIADNGGATWYICLAGEYGFSMIGVFLFVAFGNGFRYGRRYLFASQALSVAGYGTVLVFVPYWHDHRAAGIGLLIALIVLPLYVSTLLERIQEARAKAEEANLAKTAFLANMSHEIRTPLNGIGGVVDLLGTTRLTPQQGELVQLLRHSATVLRSLVDDVLDITKIEAGRITIEVAPFDLHACINGLIQLLRPHAQAKGLTLTAVVDPALEYRVKGDSHHLRQVLLNLLGNAIKFTERGEVTLVASLEQESDVAVTARFEVRDTGIGIAPEAIDAIFERFVQADQSTTRKYGGTGLGTTIAKQLVELMGGSIGVQSELGKGSTFWLELPLLRDAVPAAAMPAPSAPAEGHALCLVIAAPGYPDVAPALRSIGERFDVVSPPTAIGMKIDQLREAGCTIRAVVAACPIDQACVAFNATVQRSGDAPPALIYVGNDVLSVVDRARIGSIAGAHALAAPNPRLIANAIHAAGAVDGVHDRVDLGLLLKRERASLKILVAEDNTTNQKIMQQLLESAGHTVVLASDGEQALDLYESEAPDLAILDFNMPQRTGVEVIQAVRLMEPAGTRMPTIILSASVTPEARERAKAAGADEFIGKPFDAGQLVREIDRLGKATPGGRSNRRRGAMSPPVAERSPSARVVPIERAAAAKAAAGTLVDQARLAQLEDIARDPSFLAELVGGFMSDVEMILRRTDEALAQGDVAAIPDLMHSLKGAAVGVGATRLAALAAEIDRSAPSAPAAEVKARVPGVKACFAETSAHLNEFLHAHHKP